MKVKLLKKIRKRFSIEHFPEGVRIGDTFCNYNVFRLTDNDKPYFDKYCELNPPEDKLKFCSDSALTEKECINFLLGIVLQRLRSEYTSLGKSGFKRIKSSKVWHKI